MSVSVEISPNVLTWIGQQITSKTDAKITSLLDRWARNEEMPTAKSIRQVSQATNIPFGYFFLKNPPLEECELVHCRTINSTNFKNQSREFIDVYNNMLNIQNWMSEYNRDILGWDSLSFVGRFAENASPMKIATDIRHELEVSEDFFVRDRRMNCFNFLREKISESGVLVMKNSVVGNNNRRKLKVEEFRAFTIVDNYAPLIFINNNDTQNGKNFSLIHELAHIWLGASSLFNDSFFNVSVTKIEKICNAVAAEILVPATAFKNEWLASNTDALSTISYLAKIFPCSELVIARRALDLRFITHETYDSVVAQTKRQFELFQQRQGPKSGGMDFYKGLQSKWDKNFIMALNSSTKSGNTPYLDACRLTGFKVDTFHKLVAQFNQGQVENS